MGSLFKTKTITNSATRVSAFTVNQASYGLPIKIVFGTTTVAPVLIDYMDFTAIKHKETQRSGKGGGTKTTNITYTYTVAADMALAEGVCTGVGKVYADSKTTDLGALGLTFFPGYIGGSEVRTNSVSTLNYMYAKGQQFPWGYMQTKHPDHALVYGGTCHVAGVVDLGESSSMPNFNFEVFGLCTSAQGQPSNQMMQQFAYQKEIEISNFKANRFVEEFIFDSASGAGDWQALDSKYYTIEQSENQYGGRIPNVYTYKFNFDDREDGAYRPDPTYIRIYYEAVEANISYTATDANPADIIQYILESDVFGAQFPTALIGDFSEYSTYCRNNSILLSPAYDSALAATDIIQQLMEVTNSEYVFSQGKAKIIPYWDNLPSNYTITEKDVIDQDGESLLIERTSDADIYNVIPLEHLSRANDYNTNMVYATDEGNVELNGIKQAGTYVHNEIMNPQLAQAIAQIILQKQLYNRNKYTIRVGQEFILLEPMDACTLQFELAGLGLTSVRVISIKENADDLSLDITFEDNYTGVCSAPDRAIQLSTRSTPATNADPGNINVPLIFELPHDLSKSTNRLDLWIYASGENPYWGGCNVWVSEDGLSYIQMGMIDSPATEFQLASTLPVGTDPDTTHTPSVKMVSGELSSTTKDGADSYVTLSYVDGEFISYQTATLTGAETYQLSYIRRGLFGSDVSSHRAGNYGVLCDKSRFTYNFGENNIGKTYYFKFTSFNTFGGNEQNLSDVEPYTYTVRGIGINYAPNPIDSNSLVSYYENSNMYLEWDEVEDERNIYYEIRKGEYWPSALIVDTTTDATYQVTSGGTYWVTAAYDGTDKTYYSTPVSIAVDYQPATTIIGSNEELGYVEVGTCTNTVIIR